MVAYDLVTLGFPHLSCRLIYVAGNGVVSAMVKREDDEGTLVRARLWKSRTPDPSKVAKAVIVRAEDVVTESYPKTVTTCSVSFTAHGDTVDWVPKNIREKFIIGRSDTCNIVIKNEVVSRIHGYVSIINQGCVYIDQSNNGSFVNVNGEVTELHKKGIILSGSGTIFIGADPTSGIVSDDLAIKYKVST